MLRKAPARVTFVSAQRIPRTTEGLLFESWSMFISGNKMSIFNKAIKAKRNVFLCKYSHHAEWNGGRYKIDDFSVDKGRAKLDDCHRLKWRRTQVAKGEVCKTFMQRFKSARRLIVFSRHEGRLLRGIGSNRIMAVIANAQVVKLVDTRDLKSLGPRSVPVQVRPWAR